MIELHREAERELQEAVDWYSRQRHSLGTEFAAEFSSAISVIVEDPRRWPEDEAGLRRYLLRRFPYVIWYEYDSAKSLVNVFAVAHCARHPDYWKPRRLP